MREPQISACKTRLLEIVDSSLRTKQIQLHRYVCTYITRSCSRRQCLAATDTYCSILPLGGCSGDARGPTFGLKISFHLKGSLVYKPGNGLSICLMLNKVSRTVTISGTELLGVDTTTCSTLFFGNHNSCEREQASPKSEEGAARLREFVCRSVCHQSRGIGLGYTCNRSAGL